MATKRHELGAAAIRVALAFSIGAIGFALGVAPNGGVSGAEVTCSGVAVAAGANLANVASSAPAGTTFCLAAGTFNVGSTVTLDNGDELIGAGRTQTFLKGTNGAQNLLTASSGASWEVRSLDISGAVGDASCAPACGRAMLASGSKLTVDDVRCHDNENQCIGTGGASLVFTNNECDHNGNQEFVSFTNVRSTSCIKRVRGSGSVTITGNDIHDNEWIGVWFDFYDSGSALVADNRIVDNGKAGVTWEVAGGWGAADFLTLRDNLIAGNGEASWANIGTNFLCNGCADATITANQFDGNPPDGTLKFLDSKRGPWGAITNVRVSDNYSGSATISCPFAGISCSNNKTGQSPVTIPTTAPSPSASTSPSPSPTQTTPPPTSPPPTSPPPNDDSELLAQVRDCLNQPWGAKRKITCIEAVLA
jgi:hypothetical protein